MFRIVPYKTASESAKLLAKKLTELGGKRVISGPPSYDHRNILWGNSKIVMETLQPTASISIALNKLSTFNKLREANVSIPEFTTVKATAESWIRNGIPVVARTILNGAEGRGIVVCKTLPLVNAPLYVKLINKEKEFRVHVFNGVAIDIQEKRRRNGARNPDGTKPDGIIRNIDNNWVFCRNNIVEPPGLRELGVQAVQAVGLLFGAVDIILQSTGRNRIGARAGTTLYALEINTAPGLCESTATKYAEAILAMQA